MPSLSYELMKIFIQGIVQGVKGYQTNKRKGTNNNNGEWNR